MAEGGDSVNEEHVIITGGSELVFDFYCEVCRDDDKHLEAAGFCVDCGEYLCETCVNSHKRARPSRYHKIQDQSEMPKDMPLSKDRVSKVITTTCDAHIGEPVRFYCKVHCKFGCSTCFATVHKACSEIDNIIDKSETILDSDEFTAFIQNINGMKHTLSSMTDDVDVSLSETERCCLEAVKAVKDFRKAINIVLDGIEQQFIAKAEAVSAEEKEKMKSLEQEISDLSENIGVITTEIEDLQTSRRVCQLYIKMKEMDSEVKTLQQRLSQAEERLSSSKQFEFEPNEEVVSLLQKVESFGRLTVRDDSISCTGRSRDTTAVHTSDIDIAPDNPVRTYYYLIGSALTSPNRLVISDHTAHEMKIIDTESNRIVDRLSQKHNPSDIAVIDKDRIAVTLYNAPTVIIFRVDGKMKVEKRIPISGQGRGIAYSKNRLLVTFQQNSRLEILDLQGNITKAIQTDNWGRRIFSYARHLCVSNDGMSIYVSDLDNHAVLKLTFEGDVTAKYTGIKTPRQLCTDQHGNIFVCEEKEKAVHMLSPELTLIKFILTQADGLSGDVLSISHCQDSDRLFVGMSRRRLKVYQLL